MSLTSAPIRGFKWFVKFFRKLLLKHWLTFVLIIIVQMLQLVFDIVLPFAYQIIFDEAIPDKNLNLLFFILSLLTVAFVIYSISGVIQLYR